MNSYASLVTFCFAVFIFLAHILSYLTQNFSLSSQISFALSIVLIIFITRKCKIQKLELWDFGYITFALLMAVSMAVRDAVYGNPDNFHIALSSSIANNNIYPPILPSTFDTTMSNYHYGVDLIGASIMSLFGLDAITAHTIQIGLDVFLAVWLLFTLIENFTSSKLTSLILGIVVTFYTSINSLDFFVREIGNISNYQPAQFLSTWLMASWTSVAHMTSQLRLPSQNSCFIYVFLLITVLALNIKKDKVNNLDMLLIMLSSFMIYFTFPAFYYPILAALLIYLAFEFIKKPKETFVKSLWIVIPMIIGKFLTFTHSGTEAGGVKVLSIQPDLTWYNWGKGYLRYFYDQYYFQNLETGFDYVNPAYHWKIPLFSSITFREFGFELIIATAILIHQITKKQINKSVLIYLSAIIALSASLVLEFTPRSIETARFLHLTKIFLVLYVVIHLPYYISSLKNFSKYLPTICYCIIAVMLVPGIVSAIPINDFVIVGSSAVSDEHKNLIKELSKIHKSGDVIVDTINFKHGYTIPNIAGFYGVGGQIYKADLFTRQAAIYTLNSSLLKEIHANYVLIGLQDKISSLGQQRLKNPSLFQEVNVNMPQYHLYKIVGSDLATKPEYAWILGCDLATQYLPMQNNNQMILYASRDEAIKQKDSYRKQIASQNPVCAFWLKEQAVTR
ncbi:MAG: hypothetical protein LW817_02035 [Candidatus Caenarcaniphilales bacterium]|jgi:hypothetical protein|nr:hypothetical protein [Candidatus Caenarcaniphilales bacterium]